MECLKDNHEYKYLRDPTVSFMKESKLSNNTDLVSRLQQRSTKNQFRGTGVAFLRNSNRTKVMSQDSSPAGSALGNLSLQNTFNSAKFSLLSMNRRNMAKSVVGQSHQYDSKIPDLKPFPYKYSDFPTKVSNFVKSDYDEKKKLKNMIRLYKENVEVRLEGMNIEKPALWKQSEQTQEMMQRIRQINFKSQRERQGPRAFSTQVSPRSSLL